MKTHGNSKTLIGETFGKLTVVKRVFEKSDQGVLWDCQCICGNHITLPTKQLTSGHRSTCGCRTRDPYKKKNVDG